MAARGSGSEAISLLSRRLAPALSVHQLIERHAAGPAPALQFRLVKELLGIPEAEIGNHHDVVGNTQKLPQLVVAENADPSDPDAFDPRGQPQVLNRAAGAVEIGVHDGVAPKHMRSGASPIRGHAEIDRRLLYSLELQ